MQQAGSHDRNKEGKTRPRSKEEGNISMRIRKSFSMFLGNPREEADRDKESKDDKRIFEVSSPQNQSPHEFRTIGTEALAYNMLEINRLSTLSASNKSDGSHGTQTPSVESSPFTLEPIPTRRKELKRRPKSMGPTSAEFLRAKKDMDDIPLDKQKRSSLGLGEVPPAFRVPQSLTCYMAYLLKEERENKGGTRMLGSGLSYSNFDNSPHTFDNWKAQEPARLENQLILKVISGDLPNSVRTVQLPVIIGRPTSSAGTVVSSANGLFANSMISRKHASIFMENSQVFVTDLGSSNGTYLNGILMKSHVPYRLNDGDLLQFGLDDEEAAKRKETAVVIQIKLNDSKGNAKASLNWTETGKRSFSPGRILQEARNILSKSSKSFSSSTDFGNPQRRPSYSYSSYGYGSSTGYLGQKSSSKIEETMKVHELSSKLIALAQRIVETAENVKKQSDSVRPYHLEDLVSSIETSIQNYSVPTTVSNEKSFYYRPNLADGQRIIRTYEFIFSILALFFVVWLFN